MNGPSNADGSAYPLPGVRVRGRPARVRGPRPPVDEVRSALGAAADLVSDAVIVVDRGGVVAAVNPAAERLFCRSSAELVGQPVSCVAVSVPGDQGDEGPDAGPVVYLGVGATTTGQVHVRGIQRDSLDVLVIPSSDFVLDIGRGRVLPGDPGAR